MHLECISIAAGIYFDIFGTKRTQLECTSNVVEIFRLPLECSWKYRLGSQECPECTSNASRLPSESLIPICFGTKRTQQECTSNVVEIFRLQARMRLKYSWNVPNRMQESSRLPSESISIFSVLKESNSNALRMPSESLDCTLECIAVEIHLDIFGSKRTTRMHFECCQESFDWRSNAARMQLERPD